MKSSSTIIALVAALAVTSGGLGLSLTGIFDEGKIITASNTANGLMMGHMIVEAHEAFIPNWNWTMEEMHVIDNHPHFDYPEPQWDREKWTNRDFHHMNEELNGLVAKYFYELFSTNT